MEKSRSTILHLISSLETGGAEKQLLLTLPRLKSFKHIVCCLQKWGNTGEILQKLNFLTIFLNPKSFFDFRAIKHYREIINKYKPEVIITYLPFADFWGRTWTKKRKNIKLICFLRSTMKDWRYFPFVIINILTQNRVDYYLAVSNEVKNFYLKFGLPKNKISVIYNGVDLTKFKTKLTGKQKLKKLGDFNLNNFFVGYNAKLRKEKGHFLLFRAMRNIFTKYPNVRLLLIGDGPYRGKLEKWVKRNKLETKIIFLGYRSDIPSILKSLDIYVHSSIYEGMSNSLLEAMAAGCPIVATNIRENRELLSHQKSALLAKRTPKEIEKAVISLIENPLLRLKFGSEAKIKAGSFSIGKTIKALNKFLQQF